MSSGDNFGDIIAALIASGGNQLETSRRLGITRNAVQYTLGQNGVNTDDIRKALNEYREKAAGSQLEAINIVLSLIASRGKVAPAAQEFGMKRGTFRNRINQLGIDVDWIRETFGEGLPDPEVVQENKTLKNELSDLRSEFEDVLS